MFEFLKSEPWYKRWGQGIFFVITPLVFLPFLLRGRPSVIHIHSDPFWISNYVQSSLPPFLAEIFSYGYYQGTGAAALLALVCAIACRRSHGARTHNRPGLAWYLPAFVAGIEAMRHARLLGSRHGFIEMPTLAEMHSDWFTACASSLSVVVLCVALGLLLARGARDSTRLPLATVPLMLSVAACWFALLSLLWLGA